MKTKSNEFYRDLDLYKKRGGYCSCVTIAVFFVVVLAVLEIFVFSFFRNIRFNPKPSDMNLPSGVGTLIQPNIANGGSEQVIFSQGTLCLMLIEQKKNDLVCQISEEGIEIDGKVGYLLPSNSSIVLFPTIENGNLNFTVKKVAVGKIGISSSLFGGIGKLMGRTIQQKLSSGGKVEFETVSVSDGIMTLTYRKI